MFEFPQTCIRTSLPWNFSKFRSNKISAESPLSRTIVKISLAPFPVWGFLFIPFLIAVFAGENCFKLHLIGMRGRGWKLGCLETVFVFLAKTKFYLPIKLLFKLETYVSSFPYNFKMRIKSLVRKRCAKVDSLLTSAHQNFVNGWKKHETNFEKK